MKTIIYVLCEPESGEIRYVGKTVSNIRTRFFGHLSEARRNRIHTHKTNWVRSVLSRGCLPLIQPIGEVGGDGYGEEQSWIKYGLAEGWRLVNSTDGGKGTTGAKLSDETHRKISEALKARHQSGPKG